MTEVPAQATADIALAFEEAVVDTLVIKCKRACAEAVAQQTTGDRGGCWCEPASASKNWPQWSTAEGAELYYPRIEFCTDNGAMIAHVGCLRLMAGEHQPLTIDARARWPMDELQPPMMTTA